MTAFVTLDQHTRSSTLIEHKVNPELGLTSVSFVNEASSKRSAGMFRDGHTCDLTSVSLRGRKADRNAATRAKTVQSCMMKAGQEQCRALPANLK